MADVPPLYIILPGEKLPSGEAQEVGNKAFNLMRMAAAGLPVPPGFVLPAAWCSLPRDTDANAEALRAALAKGIARIEAATRLDFSSARRPLLVSVRSGAALSMPGMMETVLDVGLNLESVDGLIRLTGNPRLAWDSFRRLVQGFAEVVAGLAVAPFDTLVCDALANAGVANERELDYRSLRDLSHAMLRCFQDLAGEAFPAEPRIQLTRAVEAVFRSWDAPKAKSFRVLKGIPGHIGTAVTVQTMVYGNGGGNSGAGVGFTRNPANGEREFYFDFQFNSQGEDVVAGRKVLRDNTRLRSTLPEIWRQLDLACHELELLFGDAQDFEFTVQSGTLWFLQSRNAKRTPWALIRIAVDMVEEGICRPEDALHRLAEIDLNLVERTFFAPPVPPSLATAQVASIGVACGAIALELGRSGTDGGGRTTGDPGTTGDVDHRYRRAGRGRRCRDGDRWPHVARGGGGEATRQSVFGILPRIGGGCGGKDGADRRSGTHRRRVSVDRRQRRYDLRGPVGGGDGTA